jgi:hypothetical protein
MVRPRVSLKCIANDPERVAPLGYLDETQQKKRKKDVAHGFG